MDEQDLLLIEQFNLEFNKGEIYSSSVIKEFLITSKDAKYENPAAYTYNRWNKGMAEIFPLFEWLQRGEYRYLGWNYPFSGYIYHYPQGEIHYAIGEYSNGRFSFYNSEISNFSEWKQSDDDGIRIIGLNSKVTFTSTNGSISQRRKLTNNIDLKDGLINGFDYLYFESKLGQLLMNKRVGDYFIFGNTEYKIEEIN
ncbi:hypothetical protein [Mariniflexile sp.]|uniref:DUF7225 domain-containing protein n=1 Tax=Mariniflexile sp. TaxID=1979402 RepID=UPI00356A0EAE